jgi:hypothetical protein
VAFVIVPALTKKGIAKIIEIKKSLIKTFLKNILYK